MKIPKIFELPPPRRSRALRYTSVTPMKNPTWATSEKLFLEPVHAAHWQFLGMSMNVGHPTEKKHGSWKWFSSTLNKKTQEKWSTQKMCVFFVFGGEGKFPERFGGSQENESLRYRDLLQVHGFEDQNGGPVNFRIKFHPRIKMVGLSVKWLQITSNMGVFYRLCPFHMFIGYQVQVRSYTPFSVIAGS